VNNNASILPLSSGEVRFSLIALPSLIVVPVEAIKRIRQGLLIVVHHHGMMLAFFGIAIGAAGAMFLTHFLTGWIYGVRPTDTLTSLACPSSYWL
jgi:hypothetical protein